MKARAVRYGDLHAVPDSLAWYVRVGYNDHVHLENYVSSVEARVTRAVVDAAYVERQFKLIQSMRAEGAELVLDPRGAELATPAGAEGSASQLPWAKLASSATPAEYSKGKQKGTNDAITSFALAYGFNGVFAPTHFVGSGKDEWLPVDAEIVQNLRATLDREGANSVSIHYPLVLPYAALKDPDEMKALASFLEDLPIDSIWLRVANFGNDKSPAAVKAYLDACRALLSLKRPLVADHVGGHSALALLAFGAVGGIAHGIGVNERFSVGRWMRPKSAGGRSGQPRRVYFANVDMYLSAREAEDLFSDRRFQARLACRDMACCPRGAPDMLAANKTHFLNSRFSQISALSQYPDDIRASRYLSQMLATSASEAIRLQSVLPEGSELASKTSKKRLFLDGLRLMLEEMIEKAPKRLRSRIPRSPRLRLVHRVQADGPRPIQ